MSINHQDLVMPFDNEDTAVIGLPSMWYIITRSR